MRPVRVTHYPPFGGSSMMTATPSTWAVILSVGDLSDPRWIKTTTEGFELASEVTDHLSEVPHEIDNWLAPPQSALQFRFENRRDCLRFRDFLTTTFGGLSPYTSHPALPSEDMIVGEAYQINSDGYDNMPDGSVVTIYSTPASDKDTFFGADDELVYVVIREGLDWLASGYVKATDLVSIGGAADLDVVVCDPEPIGYHVWRMGEDGLDRILQFHDVTAADREAGYVSEPLYRAAQRGKTGS